MNHYLAIHKAIGNPYRDASGRFASNNVGLYVNLHNDKEVGVMVYQSMSTQINGQSYSQVLSDIKANNWKAVKHSIKEAIVKNGFKPNDILHHLINPLMNEAIHMSKDGRKLLAVKIEKVKYIVRQIVQENKVI